MIKEQKIHSWVYFKFKNKDESRAYDQSVSPGYTKEGK